MVVSRADAPQWLLSSWLRACRQAGATVPDDKIRQVGSDLIALWSAENRHFHGLRHLADVLNRVDILAEETHKADLVRLAAWYHGSVFDSASKAAYANHGGENEAASAILAQDQLSELGVPEAAVNRVAYLINQLLRHNPAHGDFDCAVLCDADLGGLAAEPQRYKEYQADVRAEYAHIPTEDFLHARIAIITKLLGRDTLFNSPMGASWEDAARQNLSAELQRLKKEQSRLVKE